MHKFQIHKLVSRRDHLNTSTVFLGGHFYRVRNKNLSYRQGFLESTKISASEELNALEVTPAQFMALRILRGKGGVQIMPFRKLSGKCHFLLRFCTLNWSETYLIYFLWTSDSFTFYFFVAHRRLLQAIVMTASDLCANYKPWDIQLANVDVIFAEFYAQVDSQWKIVRTVV